MEMSYVIAVVITGLVVVFLGLILLIAFISAVGAIFKKIDKKKAEAKAAQTAEKPAAPKTVSAVSVTASSDDGEIIAVISAAVAMMSAADGTSYRIKSVKAAAQNGSSRSAWAMAGLRETTDPF